jgi:uncharacterized protein
MLLALTLTLALPEAPSPKLVGELVELKTDTGTLYGTIDLPSRPGPWPVVILHPGSGPTDRNGNSVLTNSDNLKMVGRGLAREGIAVLRIDKRGIAASTKAMLKEEDLRFDTYAADVVAWAALLRKDKRFTKLGYLGHSEGSLVGLVAAKGAKFDAFVSLCGPGRPLQDVLREQLKKGLSDDLYKKADAIITELVAGRTVKDTPKELAALFRPSVQPFLISLFRQDPAKLVAGVPCPVLIVSGSTDVQVVAADAKRLHDANPKARLVTIEQMSHTLKLVKTTAPADQGPSYSDPALPLHPKLLPELVGFFKPALGGK